MRTVRTKVIIPLSTSFLFCLFLKVGDALKFPDMIHAFNPNPITNIQEVERFFDFCASSPESFHMVTLIYSPWGIPANYRMMQGSGVNTYKWVNSEGKAVLIKYHWEPKQGIKNPTQKRSRGNSKD